MQLFTIFSWTAKTQCTYEQQFLINLRGFDIYVYKSKWKYDVHP